ncbi:MAG: DUF2802 domain-containing protein [Rhodocyclaceae bacterium]|nr:DUF2802 domain-containing protein [Rhodocyclaceae bacterium]
MNYLDIGWRDGVLLAVTLLGVYFVLSLLKFMQLRYRHESFGGVIRLPDAPFVEEEVRPIPMREPLMATPPPRFADRLAEKIESADEIVKLRDEVGRLRREVADLRVARRVSSQYSEAMALAQRGYDARGIAAECGISVGEAELVAALGRTCESE